MADLKKMGGFRSVLHRGVKRIEHAKGSSVWKEEWGPVQLESSIPGHWAKVHFLPRPCTLRCSLQYRRSLILLNRWPVLPGLKPPSWDTRYLGRQVGNPRVGLKRVPSPADTHSNPLPQVSQMAQYFEPLTLAAVGAASKTLSHPQQMALLDQTKTLAESALQLLYTAKEAGGNPKVLRAGREGLLLVSIGEARTGPLSTHSLCSTASSSHPGSPRRGCADDDGGCRGPDNNPQ